MEKPKEAERGLILSDETFEIRGAVFEVYKEIGPGFLEAVYQECLRREFVTRKIPFVAQPELSISYKGNELQLKYIPDFICFEKIVLELKASKEITDDFRAQLHNYLRMSGLKLGLLINFGHTPKVEIERVIY